MIGLTEKRDVIQQEPTAWVKIKGEEIFQGSGEEVIKEVLETRQQGKKI
jgi:hypothetical protein